MKKKKKEKKKAKAIDDLMTALDSRLFKVLGEPVRSEILKFLLLNGRSDISTIAGHLPQDRSVISRHLTLMAEAGILVAEKETRHMYYMINGEAFLKEFDGMTKNIKKCMSACCPVPAK